MPNLVLVSFNCLFSLKFVRFTVLIFGQICCSKNVMFTVLSFGHVTMVLGLLYSVMFTGQIRSSFFGHLNNPQNEAKKHFWGAGWHPNDGPA